MSENPDEIEKINVSFFVDDKTICEQLKGGYFLRFDLAKKESRKVPFFEIGGVHYIPHVGQEIQRDVVILPKDAAPYESIAKLQNEIKSFIHRFVDVSPEFEEIAAWYVLLSWVYDRVSTINYLRARGDTGCGKSRFLEVVGRLCYKPIIGSGGVTVASVKRIVDKWRGTLVIDEGDFSDSDEKNELVKFFNLGFEQKKSMFNCDKNDPTKLEFFDPYGPKIISTRRAFDDQALEARCLTELMRQTTRKDIPDLLGDSFYREQEELRQKLLQFRLERYHSIFPDATFGINLGDVEPRIKQATRGFLALLAADTEALDRFKTFVVAYNQAVVEERSSSFDGQIVNMIVELLEEGATNITCKAVADRIPGINGRMTSDRTIGKRIKDFGLKTTSMWVEGRTIRAIELNSKFADVAKRYVVDQTRLTSITNITSITSTPTKPQSSTAETSIIKSEENVCDVINVSDVRSLRSEADLIFAVNMKGTDLNDLETRWQGDENFDVVVSRLKHTGQLIEVRPGRVVLP